MIKRKQNIVWLPSKQGENDATERHITPELIPQELHTHEPFLNMDNIFNINIYEKLHNLLLLFRFGFLFCFMLK